jgi:hypothetical protein
MRIGFVLGRGNSWRDRIWGSNNRQCPKNGSDWVIDAWQHASTMALQRSWHDCCANFFFCSS